MTGFDLSAARIAYADKKTEELIRIAYFEPGFLSAAIDLAREELGRRGVSDANHELVRSVENEIALEQLERERLANEPLHVGWKIYCFLIADLIAIIVAIVKSSSGKKRASREAMKWFGYGWLFRIMLIVGILLFQ